MTTTLNFRRRGLGRKHEFDERSKDYAVRELVEPLPGSDALIRKTWRRRPAIDQGYTSACTGFDSWGRLASYLKDTVSPFDLYHGAQTMDEWEGEDYEGSSVLGAAKFCKASGYINEYRWCFGIDDVLNALSYVGPVGLGTTWYESMFNAPNSDPTRKTPEALTVNVDSGVAGGHAYDCHGILPGRELVVCTNSWGPGWGDEGRFYLTFSDLDKLLQDDGEAVTYL